MTVKRQHHPKNSTTGIRRLAACTWWILALGMLSHQTASGQEPDTVATVQPDSLTTILLPESDLTIISDMPMLAEIYPVDSAQLARSPIPARAAIMSAVLPGLGQIYNRRVWKVPIVYACIGASVYFLVRYQNDFQRYRRAYIDLKDGDPYTNFHEKLNISASYDKERYITTYKDASRKNRDWAIIAVVLTYLMNVVDANVDAHLFNYSVDDNISLRGSPCFLENNGFVSPKIGLNLCFTF
jgi:hypothetical protein